MDTAAETKQEADEQKDRRRKVDFQAESSKEDTGVSSHSLKFQEGSSSTWTDKCQHDLAVVAMTTPVSVAVLLRSCPRLVTAAVAAFSQRTQNDEQAAQRMLFFAPETSVRALLEIPQCLLALIQRVQLSNTLLRGWPPEVNDPTALSWHYRRGIILAIGFEILVTRARPTPGLAFRTASISAMTANAEWHRFVTSLQHQGGYFQNCQAGDEVHDELMEKAHGFFIATALNENGGELELGLLIHQLVSILQPSKHLWTCDQLHNINLLEPEECQVWQDGAQELARAAELELHECRQDNVRQLCRQLHDVLATARQRPAQCNHTDNPPRKTSRKLSTKFRRLSQISNFSIASNLSSASKDCSDFDDIKLDCSSLTLDFDEEDSYWQEDDRCSSTSSFTIDLDLCHLQFALAEARK